MNNYEDFFNNQADLLELEGKKFFNDEITMQIFKATSGKFGIYAERGGKTFMARIKIPSGIFTANSMDIMNNLIEKYNMQTIHITTRQAIQFHNLSFEDTISIFKECLKNNIFNFGGGGNYPRNVTATPLSGVEKNEAFDITPYADAATNYFKERLSSYKFPRKFKVGFSNTEQNISSIIATDLGFLATIENGKKYFKCFVAGGIGKNPEIGKQLPYLIEPNQILYYIEALANIFKDFGNYENKNKARIRYIIKEKGELEFFNIYKKYIEQAKSTNSLNLDLEKLEEPIIPAGKNDSIEENINIIEQKQSGRYSFVVKPIGGIMQSSDFKNLTTFLKSTKSKNLIRLVISMEESLYINNLDSSEVQELLLLTKNYNQFSMLEQSLSCIGVPVCQIGLADSQALLSDILENFKSKGLSKDLLPKIHISGCPNSCARHQLATIGFAGKRKMIDGEIVDAFELFIGSPLSKDNPSFNESFGDIVATKIPAFLEELYNLLDTNNSSFETFKNTNDFSSLLKTYIA